MDPDVKTCDFVCVDILQTLILAAMAGPETMSQRSIWAARQLHTEESRLLQEPKSVRRCIAVILASEQDAEHLVDKVSVQLGHKREVRARVDLQ